MDKDHIKLVIRGIIKNLAPDKNCPRVPVGISNRHLHISEKDRDILFGKGYLLQRLADLKQPGQYACKETVTIAGSTGAIPNVRIIGPVRPETQVEISRTDSILIGIEPHLRNSGDIKGSGRGVLIGPSGTVEKREGFIISANHLHLSEDDAFKYMLKDGDFVNIRSIKERKIYFTGVLVRAGKKHSLEFHIDTDEANAGLLKNGDLVELLK